MTEEKHWCETLKEGDSVFVSSGGFTGTTLHPAKVKRVTATLIRVEGTDTTYNKHGHKKGQFQWDYSSNLYQDNQANRDRYEMQVLRAKLRSVLQGYDRRFDFTLLNKERTIAITETLAAILTELSPKKKEGTP